MTSFASREMTEQEMVNTCTAPQMAHLIQVLRQTIRNKDKEIERWVDIVSQLQRDGELDPPEPEPLLADAKVGDLCKTDLDEWIQIDDAPEPPSPILYHIDRPFKGNIIHTEPLADEGSAEWAWQMAKLGIETKCSRGKIRISKSGMIEVCYNGMAYAMPMTQSPENRQYVINKMRECSPDGWQLYESEPEPKFAVGDWVTDGIVTGYIERWGMDMAWVKTQDAEYHINLCNLRKLDPSEVIVKIGCLEGTVAQCGDKEEEVFALRTKNNAAVIPFTMCDPATRNLVESILRAQEEQ